MAPSVVPISGAREPLSILLVGSFREPLRWSGVPEHARGAARQHARMTPRVPSNPLKIKWLG